MAITITTSGQANAESKQVTRQRGHTRPRKPVIGLDEVGRLRVANLLAILNVSHSTLYSGIQTGRYPSPDGRDGSFPYWNTATIKNFLES